MGNIGRLGVLDIVFGLIAGFYEVGGVGVIKDIASNLGAENSQLVSVVTSFLKYSTYASLSLLIITGIVLIGYNVVLR